MRIMKVIIHILVPIALAIITNIVCMKLFYIPDPNKLGTHVWLTDIIAIGAALFVLALSSIISLILYAVQKKKRR